MFGLSRIGELFRGQKENKPKPEAPMKKNGVTEAVPKVHPAETAKLMAEYSNNQREIEKNNLNMAKVEEKNDLLKNRNSMIMADLNRQGLSHNEAKAELSSLEDLTDEAVEITDDGYEVASSQHLRFNKIPGINTNFEENVKRNELINTQAAFERKKFEDQLEKRNREVKKQRIVELGLAKYQMNERRLKEIEVTIKNLNIKKDLDVLQRLIKEAVLLESRNEEIMSDFDRRGFTEFKKAVNDIVDLTDEAQEDQEDEGESKDEIAAKRAGQKTAPRSGISANSGNSREKSAVL